MLLLIDKYKNSGNIITMKNENIPTGYNILEYGTVIEQGDLFMDKFHYSTNISNWNPCISSIGQTYQHKTGDLQGQAYYIIRPCKDTLDGLVKKLRAQFKSLGYTNIVITADKIVNKTETFNF